MVSPQMYLSNSQDFILFNVMQYVANKGSPFPVCGIKLVCRSDGNLVNGPGTVAKLHACVSL